MKLRNLLKLSALAILPVVATAQGCMSEADAVATAAPENVTEVNHQFRGKWAVDMQKVDQHYGTSSAYFLGVTAEEAGLDPQLPPVFDQTIKREPDGSLHQDSGTEYAVIDRDGNKVDPAGYVNIIPMLKNTAPSKQTHIKEVLNNGDVIVYFHPEQTGARGAMERRASHVGMHYEYTKDDGTELVHHIDNPNSYGPVYNHKPDRQMPFHVFRFKPRKGDLIGGSAPAGVVESPEGVEYTAPQRDAVLGIVNGGDVSTQEARAAFHKYLDIDLAMRADAAGKIVQYRTNNGNIDSLDVLAAIPQVGPAALKTLRDNSGATDSGSAGVAMSPEQAAAYGANAANWAMITNDISPFADFFDLRLQSLEDLPKFANAAVNGQSIPEVYCSGLAYVNLNLAINYPLNEQGLGDLYGNFQGSSYEFSDANTDISAEALKDTSGVTGLKRLVFEPYQATDILNAWIENYWGAIPLQMQQQIFQTEEFQQKVVYGFSQLEWSDDQNEEKQSSGQFKPATIDNVKRWASAYGRGADETEAYLAADQQLAEKFNALGLNATGMTPMDVLQAVEDATVTNKFVPPQIWMDEADKDDSSLAYVGTVLNCELLTAVDGSGDDPCEGGGGGVKTFKEGAADTSTYPDYALKDGGFIAHRRFDVAGPTNWGPDSTITIRITHGAVEDTVYMAHMPAHWETHSTADMPYQVFRGWCNEQRAAGGHCNADKGIVLKPSQSGEVTDLTISWRLGDICTFSDDGKTATCPTGTMNDGTFEDLGNEEVSTWADGGRINGTVVDLGATASSATLPNCVECPNNGGHYNQFKVYLKEPAAAAPDPGDDMACQPGECGDDIQAPGGCWCDSVCEDALANGESLEDEECCSNFEAVCG